MVRWRTPNLPCLVGCSQSTTCSSSPRVALRGDAPPGAAVTREPGARRPPGAPAARGVVRKAPRPAAPSRRPGSGATMLHPDLHHVRALEERGVAASCSRRAASRSRARGLAEVVGVVEVHLHRAHGSTGPGTLARKRREMPFFGLDADVRGMLVREVGRPSVPRKSDGRRAPELDRDLGDAPGQALAGAQVEGHAGPAPVVDVQLAAPRRSRCSTSGSTRGSGAVAGTRSSPASPRRTGRAPLRASTSSRRQRPDGAQHLDLLVAHRVGVERRPAAPWPPGSAAGTCGSGTMSRSAPACS